MSFELGPVRDFGAYHRAASIDPATTAGVVIADLVRVDVGRLRSRKNGASYKLQVRHFAAMRGQELRTARLALDTGTSAAMSILLEAQYVGPNPSTAQHIIESRVRWAYAFEVESPPDIGGRTYPPAITMIPPSVWQSARLGLSSQAGRAALKLASDLSAEQAVAALDITGPVVGDVADAFNMLLYWLDHQLTGVPRRFMTAAERGRR